MICHASPHCWEDTEKKKTLSLAGLGILIYLVLHKVLQREIEGGTEREKERQRERYREKINLVRNPDVHNTK